MTRMRVRRRGDDDYFGEPVSTKLDRKNRASAVDTR